MNIYLAGPIDLVNASAKPVMNWKDALANTLKDSHNLDTMDQQWTCYDPAKPWVLCDQFIHTRRRTAFIELVNTVAIQHCDIVVAHVPSTVVSVGTPIEINDAFNQGKQIIVLSDLPYGKNAYLSNRVSLNNYIQYSLTSDSTELVAAAIQLVLSAVALNMSNKIVNNEESKSPSTSDNTWFLRRIIMTESIPHQRARAKRLAKSDATWGLSKAVDSIPAEESCCKGD
jgi:nucleoside 2-deoxyribosyltransferase